MDRGTWLRLVLAVLNLGCVYVTADRGASGVATLYAIAALIWFGSFLISLVLADVARSS